MNVNITKEEFETEMVKRGYHVTPRRCTTCHGNNELVWNFPDERLFCKGCGKVEEKCIC